MKKSIDNELTLFYKQIGKNVAKYRKEAKLSQLDLSLLLKYNSSSSISQPEICYNNSHFSIGQVYLISKVLDIDLNKLLEFE